MKEIAVYGKGGIGKSTMSANISAALSEENIKVLQIGCDPKHDSTRLLLGGKRIETVLDYIRETGPLDYRLEDILSEGYNEIGCIEAGGPKPGVGCAGRGIITAFELLEKFHIKDRYDMIIYDVLGDVVCGGFAVPIRREYADTIFIVTSGEYMSIYAANNILRGIKNYDGENARVAGIIYNSRNVRDEDEKVLRFSEAVGLPVFAKIPRSDIFASAERENCTVLQYEPDSEVSSIFRNIARRILKGPTLYAANPLTDEELELLIMYGEKALYREKDCRAEALIDESYNLPGGKENGCKSCTSEDSTESDKSYECGYLSKNVIRNEPLHGCAFNGAASMSVHIKDAVILTHSPKACTYISYQSISSSGRRRLFERGTLLPVSIMPNIISTDMDESDMVFGGTDKLLDAVTKIKNADIKPKVIIIISSCPSGIIGDDIEKAKELADEETEIVTIKADGNLTGDYLQGMLMSYTQLAAQIVNPNIKPISKVVNIVFEKVVAKNTESNFDVIKEWLKDMGVRVNCRFLCNTTFDALKNFCSAELNLLAHNDYTGKILREFFESNYGCKFYDEQFPVGFAESEKWLKDMGSYFNAEKIAEAIIDKARCEYERRMSVIREKLQGKKLMIITYGHNIDWILKTAIDAGMQIVKLCILNFSQDEGFRTTIPEVWDIPREEDYNRENRLDDMRKYEPDIILSNYETAVNYKNCVADVIPMCPDVGFFSGLLMAERWAGLFVSELEGEWKNDRELFDKYYSR